MTYPRHSKRLPLRKKRFSPLILILKWIFVSCLWAVLLGAGIFLWFSADLPDLDSLGYLSRRPHVQVVDIRGDLIASYGDFFSQPVDAKQLPKHLIQALLAIEDRRFFVHWGVDPVGIARAFMSNFKAGRVVQGGSTLSQQLAKSLLQDTKRFDYRDRSLARKIMELILALQIEQRFTKNQILSMHLNRVYMGSGTWGVDAAAMRYFDKHATELNLYESAVLMGLLQAPSLYSPLRNQARSESRAQIVLQAMVEAKFITPQEADAAMALPTPVTSNQGNQSGRYFADWVMDEVYQVLPGNRDDLTVLSTLDLRVQKMAERQTLRVMKNHGVVRQAEQMALVCMNPEGAVLSMIGGMDYAKSSFNRATKALRQPGSAFKYFVYLAALKAGWTPRSRMDDRPITFGRWTASNYLYKATGSISLQQAFARSVNSVAIRLAARVGIGRVIRMARMLGVDTEIPAHARNYTLALGTAGITLLEMTAAMGTIIHDGCVVHPYGIARIKNSKGKELYVRMSAPKDPVLEPKVVQDMAAMLKQVCATGSGKRSYFDGPTIMGKTGTSNTGKLDRDLWFVGMTPQYVTGVWTGCDNEKGMIPCTPGSPPIFLWRAFNQLLIRYKKNPNDPGWSIPEGHPEEDKWAPMDGRVLPRTDDWEEDEDDEDSEDEEGDDTNSRSERSVKNTAPRPSSSADNSVDEPEDDKPEELREEEDQYF